MDEKLAMAAREGREDALGYVHSRRDTHRRPGRRALRQYIFLVVSLFVTVIYLIPRCLQLLSSPSPPPPPFVAGAFEGVSNATKLVSLEAHIMSKCPDARDCLVDLVVPAMEQIVDKVDFKLSYIGEVGEDDAVICKHGPTECLGNMMGLCATQLFPNDVKRWLGFMTCMIMDYSDIPSRDLAQHCTLEHGISFDDLNACISEEGKGLDLLAASVKSTQKAGVTKSCTVRVADEIWCIRDGAQWKNCSDGHEPKDLVTTIEKLFGH